MSELSAAAPAASVVEAEAAHSLSSSFEENLNIFCTVMVNPYRFFQLAVGSWQLAVGKIEAQTLIVTGY